MNSEDFKKWFADKYYDGDIAAYERTMASDDPESDAYFMEWRKSNTVHWSNVEQHLKCCPEYEEEALALIRQFLGYLPQQYSYTPFLAFIQVLVENLKNSRISEDEFFCEILFYSKQIRNEDMRRGGWLFVRTYNEASFNLYHTHLAPFKQAARERLTLFLGYEPALEYSLDAEIFLRQIFAEDYFYSDMPFCNVDYQAATITMYRQIFLTQGEEAANLSDLVIPLNVCLNVSIRV